MEMENSLTNNLIIKMGVTNASGDTIPYCTGRYAWEAFQMMNRQLFALLTAHWHIFLLLEHTNQQDK